MLAEDPPMQPFIPMPRRRGSCVRCLLLAFGGPSPDSLHPAAGLSLRCCIRCYIPWPDFHAVGGWANSGRCLVPLRTAASPASRPRLRPTSAALLRLVLQSVQLTTGYLGALAAADNVFAERDHDPAPPRLFGKMMESKYVPCDGFIKHFLS